MPTHTFILNGHHVSVECEDDVVAIVVGPARGPLDAHACRDATDHGLGHAELAERVVEYRPVKGVPSLLGDSDVVGLSR